MKNKGTLYLIPTPIGDTIPEQTIPAQTIEIVQKLDYFIVENLRTARRFISKAGSSKPIDEIEFVIHDKHFDSCETGSLLQPLLEGKDGGLLSEAGTPCIADPGGVVVAQAHEWGINVVPLSGPNAIILALMASGFNGQAFRFHGYLPIQENEAIQVIKVLEQQAVSTGETQIFIETPFRNNAMIERIIKHCRPDTFLCVAAGISTSNETIISLPLAAWQLRKVNFHKIPAVFLLWSANKNVFQKKRKKYKR
ncbi:MAG: SAM-dependent methyltransferase [Bacteroidales bacterium]|jgi:16S rRNA (cytidine1402-2'-O)-methyltransferase|nr:SAM-dependent methyltransferase [Bacteroidales bacterium]HOI31291.1 SAM-dependent methyltransferase [Bacteroidales bacterium]